MDMYLLLCCGYSRSLVSMVIRSQLTDFLKALKGVLESVAESKEATSRTELSHPILGMDSQ